MIAAAQGGGEEGRKAFRTLVEEHQRWLVWFLTCLLSNQADAEDVAQEVFVRAFLALERFRGASRFKTWIRRIALNQAFNHRRALQRRAPAHGVEADELGERDLDYGGLIEREALLFCLDELPYISREILVLFHVEEMALHEIAESLNIGLSATKMRLKRAREQFKERYAESVDAEARS